jgi:hypothetical protein
MTMRRMLANLFAAGCFVLFVLSAFMWCRSHGTADQVMYQDSSVRRGALSSRGGLAVFSYDRTGFASEEASGWRVGSGASVSVEEHGLVEANHHRTFLGFWFFRDSKVPGAARATMPGWCLIVPYWFFTLLFSLVPLGRALRMRRR